MPIPLRSLRFIHSTYTRTRIGRGSIPRVAPVHRLCAQWLFNAIGCGAILAGARASFPQITRFAIRPRPSHSKAIKHFFFLNMAFEVKHCLAKTRTVQQAGITPRLERVCVCVAPPVFTDVFYYTSTTTTTTAAATAFKKGATDPMKVILSVCVLLFFSKLRLFSTLVLTCNSRTTPKTFP